MVDQAEIAIPSLLELYRRFYDNRERLDTEDLIEGIALVSLDLSSTFLVFDAVDEFNDDQRSILLEAVKKILTDGKYIKLFATSRFHARGVDDFFSGSEKITIQTDTLDLKNYFTQKLSGKVSNDNLRSTIVDTLSDSARTV